MNQSSLCNAIGCFITIVLVCYNDTTQPACLTDAGGTVGCQLESLVTVAHEGPVGVEAGVSARFICTLIHIWRNNRGVCSSVWHHRNNMPACVCVCLCTLTRPAVCVEDKAWVTGAGIRSGDISAQLLAVTIATFINIWCKKKKKRQTGYETFFGNNFAELLLLQMTWGGRCSAGGELTQTNSCIVFSTLSKSSFM